MLRSCQRSLAEMIHRELIGATSTGASLAILRAFHSAFPYSRFRQALKLRVTAKAAKALGDLFLNADFPKRVV